MPNQNIPNPFSQEDWFSKVVWRDKNVRLSAKTSFYKFLQTYTKPNIFSIMKFSIIQAFAKHAVLASLITLILIGGVGASAAEFLAPEQYRLSTFIKKYSQNQQTQKDPFSSLAPDNDNFVVSATDCNLAVKYPKKIANLKTTADVATYTSSLNISDTEYFNSIMQFRIGTEQTLENQDQKTNDISVACYKKSDYDRLPKKINTKNQLSKEQFFDETGWFIFEADIKNFEDITYNETDFKYDNKYIRLLDRFVKFEFEDLVYELNYTPRSLTAKDFDPQDSKLVEQFKLQGDLDVPGIFGNQIQLQFNSIVTNTFSNDIPAKSSSSSSSSNQNSSSSKLGSKPNAVLPVELANLPESVKNLEQPFKIIDGKTYWIESITGAKSCNQSTDPVNCGNNKLVTLENGKAKTLLEFIGGDLISLQFLSSQSVDGQLYIYSCGGFGGGCRVDLGILFNPKTGKITKDDKWEYSETDRAGIWSQKSISSKIVAKDYPLYLAKKAWPTVFGNEKYFGIKDGLQYGRVVKTVEFKEGDEPVGGEYWIVANNGKELTYLFKTELSGSNYEGIYNDTLKINSRGNLVTEIKSDSYVDANKRTILVDNYTFIEQDLNTGKVIEKTENVLAAKRSEIQKKYI